MTKKKLLNKAILYFTLHGWRRPGASCPKCKYNTHGFPGHCGMNNTRTFLWFNRVTKKDTKIMDTKSSLRRSNPKEHETYAAWCVRWLNDE